MEIRNVARLALFLLVFASVGCKEPPVAPGAEPAPDSTAAAPAPAATATPGLTVLLEGLLTVQPGTVDGRPVLWALMVDATKETTKVPPCADSAHGTHYPAHIAVVFAEGADIEDASGQPLANPFPIGAFDVVLQTSSTTFNTPDGAVVKTRDLRYLVDEDELEEAGRPRSDALQFDPSFLTSPVKASATDPLLARVRINGADTLAARKNVCENQTPPPPRPPKKFRFEVDPQGTPPHDGCNDLTPGLRTAELGEDVILTQNGVNSATILLTDKAGAQTTLHVSANDPAAGFAIAFRNVLPVPGIPNHRIRGRCSPLGASLTHYSSYRWFYGFETGGASDRCRLAPCLYSGGGLGGLKCPVP